MARLIGPSEASREVKTIVATNGSTKGLFKSKATRPATFYLDSAATQLADILLEDGTPVVDSTVTIDAYSMLPLIQFPDGVDRLYVVVDGGPAWPVYAREDDRLDALATSVTAEATARASGDTAVAAAAATDASTKASAAQAAAISAAATDATTKANAAQSAAISAAATDATTKANAAQSAAISAAATDATSKANAAQSAAISAAATDATSKANAAQAAAVQRANHTGTQSADTLTDGTTSKAFLATERTKLAGIATGATANSTDAQLRDRSTHTGVQAISTVTGLQTALDGKVGKGDLVTRVEDYAAGNANFLHSDGKWYTDSSHTTLATDDTAAIRALVAAGARNLWFGSKSYLVKWTQQTALLSWTGVDGIRITGNGATLCDEGPYTLNPANPVTPVFSLDGCKGFSSEGVNYVGPAFSSPTTQIGYQGATFVRAVNGTDGVRVRARLTNLRYGVQTGDYADPSKGYCRNFDVKLQAFNCGYPWASYLTDNVELDIDASGIHRGAYIAGTNSVKGVVRWQDQYIADTVVLITDALTSGTDAAAQADPVGSPTTSRGCKSIDILSIDKGSTVMQTSTRCAGIGLSRVDPGTAFRDIKIRVHSVATSTQSQTVGACMITSAANSVWSRYTYNWEPTILLEDIKISGVIDHSGTTASGNTGSELYIYAYDTSSVHAATIRNLSIDGLTILPAGSPGVTRPTVMAVPGTVGSPVLDRFISPGMTFQPYCNTYAFLLRGCVIGTLDLQGGATWVDLSAGTVVTSTANIIGAKITGLNSSAINAGFQIRRVEKSLVLSGATSTWTPAIPAGAVVLGLQGRIINTTTGPTGYTVGPASGPADKYATVSTLAFGSTWGPSQASTAEPYVRLYPSATDIVVTATGGTFTTGGMRLVLWYLDIGTLAS